MEKKGQYVRLSAISQGGRPCSAPGLVTRGYEECQGPVWSPEGQLPYEYFKIKKKKLNFFFTCVWHVNYSRSPPPPPPTVLLNQCEPSSVQGSERLLRLAFLWI